MQLLSYCFRDASYAGKSFDKPHAPFFINLSDQKDKIAITDRDGDYSYELLFKR